jgi:hypothetical protein
LTIERPASDHERRIGQEYAAKGRQVRLRGENVAGPDAEMDDGTSGPKYWDNKKLEGTAERSLQNVLTDAKKNFSNSGAKELRLSRSDTRAIVDVRGNAVWDDPAKVKATLARRSTSGDLDKVREIEVITSSETVVWVNP